jgi:hypothetical protein
MLFLKHLHAGPSYSNVVDFYHSATGAWSTAQLSVARFGLAAASAGNFAVFAGGTTNPSLLYFKHNLLEYSKISVVSFMFEVFLEFNLFVVPAYSRTMPLSCQILKHVNVGYLITNIVDLYNSATSAWSTAQLSAARTSLAAASVGNKAIFAGGETAGALQLMG